ncbi:hypothetical protein SETIT_8G092500v2 [Setaria italica]|uniref:Uncharacterized protein n=1 Tax=Setaria italica TaxID=4555 RepID=A0A368S645_SETIT|nr:hypothetical protein SETIT_8G092500v2 [Setaria italica]
MHARRAGGAACAGGRGNAGGEKAGGRGNAGGEKQEHIDRIKLARRRLIIQGAALTVVAASVCFLQVMRRRGRGYSAQELAPLRAALAELTSAIRAATAPAEPHPDLYPTVMCIPGFTREELLVALSYLVDGRGRGAAFLAMSEPHRALWIKHILAKQEI